MNRNNVVFRKNQGVVFKKQVSKLDLGIKEIRGEEKKKFIMPLIVACSRSVLTPA